MTTASNLIDLDSPDLEWIEHSIAGSDLPARLAMLHADPELGTRSVLVKFPDGWSRDAVGSQPAGEEMVILSGALSISGQTATPGQYLVVEPRATRSATSVADGTSALVFFSGPGGGWEDGEHPDAGTISVLDLAPGELRPARAGLVGAASVVEGTAGEVFDGNVEVVWPADRRYAFVSAGDPVPDGAGRAVIQHR